MLCHGERWRLLTRSYKMSEKSVEYEGEKAMDGKDKSKVECVVQ